MKFKLLINSELILCKSSIYFEENALEKIKFVLILVIKKLCVCPLYTIVSEYHYTKYRVSQKKRNIRKNGKHSKKKYVK